MRVGFDVSLTAERMAGCAIVADQFLRNLVPAFPSDEFMPYPIFGGIRSPNFVRATRPNAPNVSSPHFDLSWEDLVQAWDKQGPGFDAFLGDPDVIHSNNFSCPRDVAAPIVYTLYDLSPIEMAVFHTEENRMLCFNGMYDAGLAATRFIAISESTRDRFLHWFPHVPADAVTVIPLAARPSITAHQSDTDIAATLAKFNVMPDEFWFAVGTIEPRKNYALLLDAYAQLVAETPAGQRPRPLCIAGQTGWLESSLEPRIRRLGLESLVRGLGYVHDHELTALYRSCLGFVYPSHYEGFGLPVIEAMACGAAVIAAHTTSLPEVVGDAGFLVDIQSAEGCYTAMATLASDPVRRDELRAAARERAATFSWAEAARRVRDVYARTQEHRA
jgi:glycosyltransferase involved in cell wall biosynthesis